MTHGAEADERAPARRVVPRLLLALVILAMPPSQGCQAIGPLLGMIMGMFSGMGGGQARTRQPTTNPTTNPTTPPATTDPNKRKTKTEPTDAEKLAARKTEAQAIYDRCKVLNDRLEAAKNGGCNVPLGAATAGSGAWSRAEIRNPRIQAATDLAATEEDFKELQSAEVDLRTAAGEIPADCNVGGAGDGTNDGAPAGN